MSEIVNNPPEYLSASSLQSVSQLDIQYPITPDKNCKNPEQNNPLSVSSSGDLQPKTWQEFVQAVGESANKSLVSLLRNSVVLKLDNEELIISYKNTALFSEAKRVKIEKAAKDFFNASISVQYKESGVGLDDSLRMKKDEKRKKKIQEIKKQAAINSAVVEVLKIFPESKIQLIEILDKVEI